MQPTTGRPRPTSAPAVAALVTGILGLGVVAFVLGAIGLHRTTSRDEQGRGFAVAGLALGAVQCLLASALIPLVLLGGAEFARTAVTDLRTGPSLTAGDCFDENSSDGSGSDVIGSGADAAGTPDVSLTSCATDHDGEVTDTVTLQMDTLPSSAWLEQYADGECSSRVGDEVNGAGLSTDDFTYGYYYPDQDGWDSGDRDVVCTVYAATGTLRGSLHQGTLQAG